MARPRRPRRKRLPRRYTGEGVPTVLALLGCAVAAAYAVLQLLSSQHDWSALAMQAAIALAGPYLLMAVGAVWLWFRNR